MSLILRPSPTSSTVVDVREDVTAVSAGSMSVSVHKDYGTFVNGPFSVSASPTSMTFGGFYKFNPVALSGMPSTIITPVPTFEVTVPTKNIATQQVLNSIVVSTITGIF